MALPIRKCLLEVAIADTGPAGAGSLGDGGQQSIATRLVSVGHLGQSCPMSKASDDNWRAEERAFLGKAKWELRVRGCDRGDVTGGL